MQKQKKSYEELKYILQLLSKGRESLLSPFLGNMNEWICLSFKYERNSAAFNLVREKFKTLWIDEHLTQLIEDGCPYYVKRRCVECISALLGDKESLIDDSTMCHSLLTSKKSVINELLRFEDCNNEKLDELRFSYEKDKALFERLLIQFEKEK